MIRDLSGSYLLLIAVLLLAIQACGKEERASFKELPDLGRHKRSYVTTQDTAVRSGPGSQYRIIAEIRSDSKVDAVGRDGEWLLVVSKRGNPPGYINAGSARAANGATTLPKPAVAGLYELQSNTQVRSGPGVHHEVIAKVPKGMKINVVGAQDGWLKVESKHGKPPGYVGANYARPLGDQVDTR